MTAYEMLPHRNLVKRKRQAERRIVLICVAIVLAFFVLFTYVTGLTR